MADLTSLIERIEAATEGGRELDKVIWLACTSGATRDKWSYIHKATGRECTVDETRDATGRLIIVPEYTTSIDAALTLLPDDWRCGFEHAGVLDSDQRPLAWCWPFGSSWEPDWQLGCDSYKGHDRGVQAAGATAPLALLAAILRARQTEPHHDES